jgi:hypothetical protein
MKSSIKTEKIGKLGFGYMRLPRKDNDFDKEQIIKMVDAFFEGGGTYFDTAYGYSGSEVVLGETVIKRYPRERFQIATKMPIEQLGDDLTKEQLFNTSLKRLGTDYIDFYLYHALDATRNKRAKELGLWDYLAELKSKGQIRHLGFSFHSSPEELDEILTNHPQTEFVQLQLNYLDWNKPNVNAHRLYEVARKHDVPIIVMEPLFGGKLASVDSPIAELMNKFNPNASLASWALRYVAQLEGVFVTLSGMSTYAQMTDNVATYKALKPLSEDEQSIINEAVNILTSVPCIECTGCDYCKDCPAKIRIPILIRIYNDYLVHKTTTNLDGTYDWITESSGKAQDCTACGICEAACPQKLEIIDTMTEISKLFD